MHYAWLLHVICISYALMVRMKICDQVWENQPSPCTLHFEN